MDTTSQGWTGRSAPAFRLRNGRHTLALDTLDAQPVVLAFLGAWSKDDASDALLDRVRAELRGLGAMLVILAPSGLFVFRPDDELEQYATAGELDPGEVTAMQVAFGIREGSRGSTRAGLFVIDEAHVVRFAQSWEEAEAVSLEQLTDALACAGRVLVQAAGPPPRVVVSRRELVMTSLVAGFALVFLDACRKPDTAAGDGGAAGSGSLTSATSGSDLELDLLVNGATTKVRVDPRTTLLDALRERMGLTGTKKGCDHGQCGACTVHLDGRRVKSCLLFAAMVEGAKITTIEGLASGETLHPMQEAFVSEDGLQCGYCTPGQIMSAVAMLAEGHASTDAEVRDAMSGNLCRCGAYTNIVSAIQLARKRA